MSLGVAAAGFAIDQITKTRAFSGGGGPLREVAPGLLMGLPTRNGGVLGGLGDHLPLVNILSVAAVTILLGLLVHRSLRESLWWGLAGALGWGLLLAGALGNAADRLLLGYVRDFLRMQPCPTWAFNLADLLVVSGALILLALGSRRLARPPMAALA